MIVEDLIIRPHTIRYRLAEYETGEGYVIAPLPESVRSGHWGSSLHSFILYQYHHQHVTQPLLLEQLHDLGIDISSGQLSQILTKDLDLFAWFESTESKSRVNFLELLSRGGCQAYVMNVGALEYMQRQQLPKFLLESLEPQTVKLETLAALVQWLGEQGVSNRRHRKILTEGMLIGRLLDQGVPSILAL